MRLSRVARRRGAMILDMRMLVRKGITRMVRNGGIKSVGAVETDGARGLRGGGTRGT